MGQILKLALMRLYRLLFKNVILILVSLLIIGLGIACSGTYYLSRNLVESQALQFAKVGAKTLNEARTLYSQNVVGRLQSMRPSPSEQNIMPSKAASPIPQRTPLNWVKS